MLAELVDSNHGATGAILADWEGESVEQHCHYDPYELKIIAAHKGIIMNRMKEISDSFPGEEVHDAVVTTDDSHIIVGAVGSEYTLVMTLGKDAVLGTALRSFRAMVKLLKKEIY